MNALGMYIFGGSQTIGHLQEGWDVQGILEMTEDMKENNSYHFVKNYGIPVYLPSEWNDGKFLDRFNDIDFLFANPPCSGLSSINRNASVDNEINNHIYEVAQAIDLIKPKAFLIENAPTLVSKGLPILKDISKILRDSYRITIITDLAGNHGVPMHRRRTLVVGWRRDIFKLMPFIDQNVNVSYVKDAFSGLTNNTPNMTKIDLKDKYDFSRYYDLVNQGDTVVKTLCYNLDKVRDTLTEDELSLILRTKEKYDKGGSVWDKSPLRLEQNWFAPSITSVNRYIHPTENRDIYIRECARLMGYPDDFIFYEGSGVSIIQAVAQGVPVNFIRYISKEIQKQFNTKVYYKDDCDIMYINQSSGKQKVIIYKLNDFINCKSIDKGASLREIELW